MLNLAVYQPRFNLRHFLWHWLYNFLFMMPFGPFGSLLMLCFEGKTYIENMGFLPGAGKVSLVLFSLQIVAWIIFAGPVYLYVRDQYQDDEYQDKYESLDIFPLLFLSILVVTRITIIAIRYGTTHAITLDSMRKG